MEKGVGKNNTISTLVILREKGVKNNVNKIIHFNNENNLLHLLIH